MYILKYIYVYILERFMLSDAIIKNLILCSQPLNNLFQPFVH